MTLLPPWPEYPCHPCTSGVPGSCSRENVRLDADGFPTYGESSGYFWHSAKWDRVTGKWDAVCCEGHRKRGRSRTGRLVRRETELET